MSSRIVESSHKVRPEHLDRAANVYVRQSSFYQVQHNLESQRRQYDLRHRAMELGWPAERVVVVDEDQGKSSRDPGTRDGFTSLATAVGRGEVGIVLSLEASRLARNNPEWHHLLYLCRWTGTLIGDEFGIYDLADANDRLLLGIRGQMSELELETMIHRMVEGRRSKAHRGEFLTIPPAGYEIDELGQLVITSDLAVQETIGLERNEAWVGRRTEVLVDEARQPRVHDHEGGGDGGPRLVGRNREHKLVHFNGPESLVGQIVHVEIERAGAYSLNGQMLKAPYDA